MQKIWLFMCLLAVLGLQDFLVKCTAAIFFRSVDSPSSCGPSFNDRQTCFFQYQLYPRSLPLEVVLNVEIVKCRRNVKNG